MNKGISSRGDEKPRERSARFEQDFDPEGKGCAGHRILGHCFDLEKSDSRREEERQRRLRGRCFGMRTDKD